MKLMGKDITPSKVMAYVGERLAARGLVPPDGQSFDLGGVEPRVDPLSFNLRALEGNADPTVALPLETHRHGFSGRVVVLAKRVFRAAGQVFINETLGRQRVFNGHVLDAYAQLSAEVKRLRTQVAELQRAPVPATRDVALPPAQPVEASAPAVPAPKRKESSQVAVEVKEVKEAKAVKETKATKVAPKRTRRPGNHS